MSASPLARKFVRIALSSVTVGTALALVLLGGPADAFPDLGTMGRGI